MANTCTHGQVSSNEVQAPFLTCFDALAIVQKRGFRSQLRGKDLFAQDADKKWPPLQRTLGGKATLHRTTSILVEFLAGCIHRHARTGQR
ncbi:MAG: hypothetical protein WA736_13935 [Candidatus Acidiferrum sp.]